LHSPQFTLQVVGTHKATLVKFDKKYAYGEKEDEFVKFAKTAATHADMLIAEVGGTDWGEKENQDLMDRFGIKQEDYPTFKLFMKGQDPITFSGDVTENSLLTFTQENTGFHFDLPGTIKELNELAYQFVQGSANDYSRIVEEVESMKNLFKEKAKLESAKTYLNIMKKISTKGLNYIEDEVKRIQKMMKEKLTEQKMKSFEIKLNILKSFQFAVKRKDEL